MPEIQLQSKTVAEFSQRFPHKRGQLFHVSNERNHTLQAMQAKAIGIFNGVSDLIYLELFHPRENETPCTMFVGIELKELGSRHKREKIEAQVAWGEILESCGGVWRLCRTTSEAISCTQLDFKGLTLADVKTMLSDQKTKTIKF
jgi:hypothetical protein